MPETSFLILRNVRQKEGRIPYPLESVGLVDGEPVAHVAVAPFFQSGYCRAMRLVVMPEWQGAGIGTRFLSAVCQWHLDGNGRCGRRLPVLFHTSHPQLAAALRRSPLWAQKSAVLYQKAGTVFRNGNGGGHSWYGGHFRAVQGFAYMGAEDA
ncbi:MAG: GNAT family N-acetyltransferase [Treponemataceae bacterium]|nr:GNAT family N-acetyltransferase [Treponemataceae bacterium]